ncbi:FAD-dependent oxidoreductase [Streptomyces sp. NBC_00726]
MTDEHRRPTDAVVVGAGLARALDLCRPGLKVALLEASDSVGGRMRTDRRDGFLLDRGFQVFNTSYPQVKRRLDLRSLRLRPFTAGIVARTRTGPVRLADPTWEQGAAGAPLPGRVLSTRDLGVLPRPLSRTTRIGPGRYVCGDHRATGSVQGALASGTRAAREVAADLARRT